MPFEKLPSSENLMSVFFIWDMRRIYFSSLLLYIKLNEYLNNINLERGRIISPSGMFTKYNSGERPPLL